MKVIIRTEWPDVVRSCMFMMEFGSYVSAVDGNMLQINFLNDDFYREVVAWLGAALACGLILRGEIER